MMGSRRTGLRRVSELVPLGELLSQFGYPLADDVRLIRRGL